MSTELFDGVEELELVTPTKYRLDIYGDDDTLPIATRTTYGGWTIEGDFLCTWTADSLKQAERLTGLLEGTVLRRIITTELTEKNVNAADEEADNPQGGE